MIKKIKLLCFSLFTFFLVGCNSNLQENGRKLVELQDKLDSTKAKLHTVSAELAELKNSPEQRLLRAEMLLAEGKRSEAKAEFEGIVKNYNGTSSALLAQEEITKIDKALEEERLAEERKKTLGFKILKPTNSVKIGELTIKFERVWTGKRWSFDDHGREYFLRDATRGNTHILARVSITSESKNPSLPPVLVYQMKEGELQYTGTLGYEFRRWKDYGSFLGNYADYGNDFAHSGTIPFNLGYEISNDKINNNATYVVVKNSGCFVRTRKIGRPEVAYEETFCGEKKTLTVDDFDTEYTLIKIF